MADTQNFQQKVAHFVEVTTAINEAQANQLQQHEQTRTKHLEKVAGAVDELIKVGYVKESARAAAVQKLADPDYALDQLVKMAKSAPPEGPARIGAPVDSDTTPKTAAVSRPSQPRRGAHHDEFVRNLGLDPATLGS